MMFIDAREVYNGTVPLQEDYLVKTNVVSYANGDIDEVNLYYSINGNEYTKVEMSQYESTTNYTYKFANLSSGDNVKYYIEAKDSLNNKGVDPTCGINDPHSFSII